MKTLPEVISISVIDDALPTPVMYRSKALELNYESVATGETEIFHGIATPGSMKADLPRLIHKNFPQLVTTMTFFRKSPLDQFEPNYIHTDVTMGMWTAILYLNQDPPPADGTTFWRHREKGMMAATENWDAREDWKDTSKWEPWQHVRAKFNRLMLFPANYFHSRAIFSNYGIGNEARLIQVAFGTGSLEA